MRVLKREQAIEKIKGVIEAGDNDILQQIYTNDAIARHIAQVDIFKMWHGFKPVEELSTEALTALVDYLRLSLNEVYEYTDCSGWVDEYLATIENPNTQYVTKTQLMNVVRRATEIYQKDLFELTKEEAATVADGMISSISPATVKRCLNAAAAFCKWCITTGRAPAGLNSFYRMPMPTLETWVATHLIKDVEGLLLAFNRARNKMNATPIHPTYVIGCLAWMGFQRQTVLEIKNEDVSFFDEHVMGVPYPPYFRNYFRDYLGLNDLGEKMPADGVMTKYYQEDLGYFLKRVVSDPTGVKFDSMNLIKSLLPLGYSYENIWLSRCFYDAYQQEMLTKEPFGLKQMSQRLGISEQAAKVQMQTYEAYKSHFWESAK